RRPPRPLRLPLRRGHPPRDGWGLASGRARRLPADSLHALGLVAEPEDDAALGVALAAREAAAALVADLAVAGFALIVLGATDGAGALVADRAAVGEVIDALAIGGAARGGARCLGGSVTASRRPWG